MSMCDEEGRAAAMCFPLVGGWRASACTVAPPPKTYLLYHLLVIQYQRLCSGFSQVQGEEKASLQNGIPCHLIRSYTFFLKLLQMYLVRDV